VNAPLVWRILPFCWILINHEYEINNTSYYDSTVEQKRYRVKASYKIEQRRGFVVSHVLEEWYETASEVSNGMSLFLRDYNSEYCHSLDFHVVEKGK